jgi:hypothetical protein
MQGRRGIRHHRGPGIEHHVPTVGCDPDIERADVDWPVDHIRVPWQRRSHIPTAERRPFRPGKPHEHPAEDGGARGRGRLARRGVDGRA